MTYPVPQSGGRHRRPRLLLLLLVAGLLAAGLASGLGSALAADPSASPAADKVVLHVGWTNDPDNLNPFIGAETSSYEIWLLNYDFLTGYSLDLKPTPDLATSWETSPDGKTWTFHLREGVKWQDGEPFTAADVAFTYNYIVDNQMGALSSLTTYITEAVAIDDLTVEIRCSKPKANMITTWIPILPEHVWSKVSPKAAGASYQNKPPIVGTGPFQTVEVKKGDYVRMVASPTFWGQKPTIDEILFVTYQNPDTMTQDLIGGSLDAAWGIPSAQFPKLESEQGIEPISYNLLTWTYLAMNCYEGTSRGNPVLKDVAFRQALNWGIDRQKIVDLAWAGKAKPGHDDHDARTRGSTRTITGSRRPTSRTPTTRRRPRRCWTPRATRTPTATAFARARTASPSSSGCGRAPSRRRARRPAACSPAGSVTWASRSSTRSWTTASTTTASGPTRATRTARTSTCTCGNYDGYADPGDTLASFITSQIENWNEPCWSNAEYDAVVSEANTTLDPEKRKELVWRAQQIFYEQSPEIATDYPDKLEAIDTAHWDGWTRMYGGTGAAFYTSYVRDSYLNLKPKAAVAEGSSGGLGGTMIAVIAAVVVLAVIVVVWILVRGRRGRAAEEE